MEEKKLEKLKIYEEEILYKTTQVMEKHDLQYFLLGGTAIGAVRHQGFIPWDDDIDIAMPYKDYMVFLKIAQKEMGEEYFVQSPYEDNSYWYPYAKVRKNGTTMIPKGMEKIHTHQGIWIDIFPMAGFKNDLEFKIKRKLLPFYSHLIMDEYMKAFEASFTQRLGRTVVILHKLIYKVPFRIRKRLANRLHHYLCGGNGKKYCAEVFDFAKKYPYSIMDGVPVKMKFEKHLYHMFPNYPTYLKTRFGDYMKMPPIEERVTHSVEILDFERNYEEYLI